MNKIHVGDVVGDYEVIGVAGSGGMGTVYKIEHLITRRIEAMKLLPAGLSAEPEQVHRFEREIQLQARLHHPNIVTLYNAIRDGDSIALVMEFVEGDSLQRTIAAGPLPVETAVNFAIQVLRALSYAHESGVIHRDVSPANIIITPDLVAKLTDFGLAVGATDLRLSTTGVALGSPWYMSPEQVRGLEKLDARTDIYALGAVLHEMLTGRKLFEAEGSFAVMRAHVEAVPQPPGSINPRVPPALDAIVSKALAKDPAARFQSADEFRLALLGDAVEAATLPKQSAARREWLAAMPVRLPGVQASLRTVLLVVVPTVLAAGLYAVRFFPAAKHAPSATSNQGVADISRNVADPPAPVIAATLAPEAPPVAAAPPVESPAPPEASIVSALPRPKATSKAVRQPVQVEPVTALRITGGEPHPAAAIPAPRRETATVAESAAPPAPKASPADSPPVPAPSAAPTPSEPPAILQVAQPANPPSGGNRFVRALGKVNPLRLLKKTETDKNQLRPE